ncbi:hypothetical protein T440DRAFT_284773 [Plenodomus tracheiphilus IPT5]|uniref:Uncharacterized protein n=1 Tax=Plenodomus tracheiphilus IPT5 TaxID=1408161 RepID=A0A6A7APF0_9PLEO|nr:hypothetical protein T440DRAFT_284773 [Plenodomus tracheiphilus IPT5]
MGRPDMYPRQSPALGVGYFRPLGPPLTVAVIQSPARCDESRHDAPLTTRTGSNRRRKYPRWGQNTRNVTLLVGQQTTVHGPRSI